jgi:hypothetical protein
MFAAALREKLRKNGNKNKNEEILKRNVDITITASSELKR